MLTFRTFASLWINKTKLEITFNPNMPKRFQKLMGKCFKCSVVQKMNKYLKGFMDVYTKNKPMLEAIYG